ncbi:ultraviolet-B receptor UVR8 isoform X2 [Ricinus communis]|uniref:ultraviolet-B receptor UVR8 isoform X2 n=1 Tax=Ricinus communis TaxID=3988 RepID=UPI00201AE805|nr:ultraviolet-B receptor UVR8 isoform X2 [Ricinus communis]
MAINGNGEEEDVKMEECCKVTAVYMCGYLPGISPEKSPILSPIQVPISDGGGFDSWKDVCSGGCGFAMAISGSGNLITWGSTDEEGQSYLTSGKHGEIPEPFPLPCEASVVKAAAGWAHCVSVTETGEVFTWGWKECVPSVKIIQRDNTGKQNALLQTEKVSSRSEGSSLTRGTVLNSDSKRTGDEIVKRRRVSPTKEDFESSPSGDEFFTVLPLMVTLAPGVRITNVAAGGRHTLALSDMGQVWGWGYGGEGQLGLGSRIKMVSSPHLIPCIDASASGKDRSLIVHQGNLTPSAQASTFPGSYVKEIACGGRHSAIVTDTGALLTFGWGLYGQCGQGTTNDQLRPACVPALSGIKVISIAAGLWHTVCISADGHVYTFGGNQFGQLGTDTDQTERMAKYTAGVGTSMVSLA